MATAKLFLSLLIISSAHAQDSTCYRYEELSPFGLHPKYYCNYYGYYSHLDPGTLEYVGNLTLESCVRRCKEYEGATCRSIYYKGTGPDGCLLGSRPPRGMGYHGPRGPLRDDGGWTFNDRCFNSSFIPSSLMNGDFSQGDAYWEKGPFDNGSAPEYVNTRLDQGLLSITSIFDSDHPMDGYPRNSLVYQSHIGLCWGRTFELSYKRRLSAVKGTIIIDLEDQRDQSRWGIGIALDHFHEPRKNAPFRQFRHEFYTANLTGQEGYLLSMYIELNTTSKDFKTNSAMAIVEFDDFVIREVPDGVV